MHQPPKNSTREKEIFFEAIERPTPEERAAYLDTECGDDSVLRERVEKLVLEHFNQEQDSFMKHPAVESPPTEDFVDPMSLGQGTISGRYKLLEKLGEGGFGAVYVAEQREPMKRRVAVKIIKLGMDTKQVVARFEAERQALALMDHPNIAKVFDAGATSTGRPFFVMELVRGIPLTDYCDENNLATAERIELFIAVCHAIQHAHQKGIIHRDIKPSNILVTLHDGEPVPKVIDFGIAKATQSELTEKTIYTQFQQFIGTPAYISPEQAEMSGLDIDTRSDIYSLGVLLYELLIGMTPFDGKELLMSGLDEMRRVICEIEPQRPSTRLISFSPDKLTTTAKRRSADTSRLIHALRGDLDWIVMKALEKDRRRRYDTARGLADDLKRFLNNEPVSARPPSATYRFGKLVRRHRRAAVTVTTVATALVLCLAFATFAFVRERTARLNQLAAEKEKLSETVRADSVANFMEQLLRNTAPEMLQQGHQRPVRDLLQAADQFAGKALSNAPGAEFHVRSLMAMLYMSDGPSLLDPEACYEQVRRTNELLEDIKDDELPIPRDLARIGAVRAMLWAGHTKEGLAKYRELREEFNRRKPPAKHWIALVLAGEANWHLWMGDSATAESQLAEALPLVADLNGNNDAYFIGAFVRGHYCRALADRGAFAEAEKIARDSLLPTEQVTDAFAPIQTWMLLELSNVLCQQSRFDEADSILGQQMRALEARGGPARELLMLQKLRGSVLARSGNAEEALPTLMSVATSPLSSTMDCIDAASVAIGANDEKSYRELCAIALSRFTAGAEGISALSQAEMFLAAPQDAVISVVTSDLVQRVERARDFSRGSAAELRHWLQLRQGRAPGALLVWPRTVTTSNSSAPIAARFNKSDYLVAIAGFRTALACAQADRGSEALRAYSDAIDNLGELPSPQHPRDLGEDYPRWYLAEAHRREVEQLFRSKHVEVPTNQR